MRHFRRSYYFQSRSTSCCSTRFWRQGSYRWRLSSSLSIALCCGIVVPHIHLFSKQPHSCLSSPHEFVRVDSIGFIRIAGKHPAFGCVHVWPMSMTYVRALCVCIVRACSTHHNVLTAVLRKTCEMQLFSWWSSSQIIFLSSFNLGATEISCARVAPILQLLHCDFGTSLVYCAGHPPRRAAHAGWNGPPCGRLRRLSAGFAGLG